MPYLKDEREYQLALLKRLTVYFGEHGGSPYNAQ